MKARILILIALLVASTQSPGLVPAYGQETSASLTATFAISCKARANSHIDVSLAHFECRCMRGICCGATSASKEGTARGMGTGLDYGHLRGKPSNLYSHA